MNKAEHHSMPVSLEKEERDLQEQIANLTFEIDLRDCRAALNMKVLVFGSSIRAEDERYSHAFPLFCRVFCFFGKGGRIRIDGGEHEFVPGRIYLLGDSHPFDVEYFAGSELLFAHVSITDYTLQSVFSEAAGLQSVDVPELLPLLKKAWARRDPMKIGALLGTVLAEFLPFENADLAAAV